MSASAGILDTSTVILLPRLNNASALPAEPTITAITLAELSVGPGHVATDLRHSGRKVRARAFDA